MLNLLNSNNINNNSDVRDIITMSNTGTSKTTRRRCICTSTTIGCYKYTTTVILSFMLLLLLLINIVLPLKTIVAFQSISTPVQKSNKNTVINFQCTTNTNTNTRIVGLFQSSKRFKQQNRSYLSSSSSVADETNDSSIFSSTTTATTNEKEVSDTKSSSSVYKVQANDRIILFDGVCNFCNRWVDILLRIDVNGVYKLTPLQSNLGKSLLVSIGKDQDDMSSIVLIQPKQSSQSSNSNNNNNNIQYDYYTKSDCVVEVIKQLGIPGLVFGTIVSTIIPKQLQDTIYDTVSENRYNLLGKRDICRSGDPQYYDRFIS